MAFVGNDGEALFERPKVASELYSDNPWLMWGEWRVESFSLGDQATRDPGIRVLFKTGHIEAEASCKSWRLPYQQEGDRLTIQSNHISGCERDDFYSEQAFSKIMAGEMKIQRFSPMERLLVGSAGSIRLVRLGECARPEIWRVHCYRSWPSFDR